MTSTTSDPFPLATENPYTGGQDASAGSANAGGGVDDSAGAAGSSSAFQLSHGALVAIIVVVVVVAVGGSMYHRKPLQTPELIMIQLRLPCSST